MSVSEKKTEVAKEMAGGGEVRKEHVDGMSGGGKKRKVDEIDDAEEKDGEKKRAGASGGPNEKSASEQRGSVEESK